MRSEPTICKQVSNKTKQQNVKNCELQFDFSKISLNMILNLLVYASFFSLSFVQ